MVKKQTREAWLKKSGMKEPPHRHWMYCFTVQCPETEVPWLKSIYKKIWKKNAVHFREDFCGTGFLSAEWACQTPDGTAVGIDYDKPTVDWGGVKHLEGIGDAGARIKLLHLDVREAPNYQSQIIHAGNNSWAILRKRKELLDYVVNVRETMCKEGIFVMDVYGGPGGFRKTLQPRDCEMYHEPSDSTYEFEYRWETCPVNPVTHEQTCYIHFTRPCGEELNRAYTYKWRIYSMPELLDILEEAGMDPVVYWEKTDPRTGEGVGTYAPVKNRDKAPDWYVHGDEYWTAYVISTKRK